MNDLRGSIWHKWDLHVHTPASIVHKYSGENPWERFITELEQLPDEFKVIGINDYIFLEGYKRILNEKKNGRLQNIDLFLPVIELRLDKFGGSPQHLSRVNCHILFSNEISPEVIEQQFINALSSKYVLTPQYEYLRTEKNWSAIPTKESLTELGKLIIESVPADEQSKFNSPLIEGFNNLCISFDNVYEVLQSHYFKDKVITAVGKTEWADIKWNDHSIAEKKTIINKADLVFMSANTQEELKHAREHLTESKVNNRLLDCSDAHMFSDGSYKDRIGKCLTWIKADTTFEGLKQLKNEYQERVFLGNIPESITQVQNNPTKYIRKLRIEKKVGSTISEKWFENEINFNTGLIAVIGNKGKGKSALTDIVGLMCNTRQYHDFTFLSKDNFKHPRENKAKHFQSTLFWESGQHNTKGLEETVDITKPELAKYIPQNFLEKLCTQIGNVDESDFDNELKKVIFSHVDEYKRLGQSDLESLITYRTLEANSRISILKEELHHLNEQIISNEEKNLPEYQIRIENLILQKQQELEAHDKLKPQQVSKPENDPTKQKELSEITEQVENALKDISTIDTQISQALSTRSDQSVFKSLGEKFLARVENLERVLLTFKEESVEELKQMGIEFESIVKITINKSPILEKIRQYSEAIDLLDKSLDDAIPESLSDQKKKVETRLKDLKIKLDEPNRKYQEYCSALKGWEEHRTTIEGTDLSSGSLKYYQKIVEGLSLLPDLIQALYTQRLAKSKEIHEIYRNLANIYRDLYNPINSFIETSPIQKEKFNLNFDVSIIDKGFEQNLFDFISHGVNGSYCGIEEGHKKLILLLQRQNFNTEEGIERFLIEIFESLRFDKRSIESTPVKISDQVRKGKSLIDLYDMIFGLDYLKPRYLLRMGDKELNQLSPGERGALLLVFYLFVDKDDTPLIIDQPEENLDNQTVYELLVPFIKYAKKRRQIIIVTHNPNLAVVCDAEQIIYANLDKKNNFQMEYLSGAIENPVINKAIVDVLEGTMPAFAKRDSKYYE